MDRSQSNRRVANMRNCIRHGDVFFKPVDKLPEVQDYLKERTTIEKRKSPVILEGEVTGHFEIIDYYEKTWRSDKPILTQTFVQAKTPSVVTHEEHGRLPIPLGLYEIIRAREFDYASNLSRRVLD
jgi:hypothetical protein